LHTIKVIFVIVIAIMAYLVYFYCVVGEVCSEVPGDRAEDFRAVLGVV
jgi:hypothetical protein